MASVSGLVYINGDFVEGHVEITETGNCFREGEGSEILAMGIIVPKFVNCHTHLGDVFIPKPDRGDVAEIVAPPDGLKHRMLRGISAEEHIAALHAAVVKMAASGTSYFIDFREGGLEGARRLLNACVGTGIRPVIFGRPEAQSLNGDELDALLAVADGIGISGIADWDFDQLKRLARRTKEKGKPFALHASETVREDIDTVMELEPAFLIHMAEASDSDFEVCASKDVPVVICPSANSFFGIRAPVERMLEAGVSVCLGTDNAMLAVPDLFNEMRALRALVPRDSLSDARLFHIIFANGRKVLNSVPGLGAAGEECSDFLVIDKPLDNPFRRALEATAEDIHPISFRGPEGEIP